MRGMGLAGPSPKGYRNDPRDRTPTLQRHAEELELFRPRSLIYNSDQEKEVLVSKD